jgi:hypothetical protein
MTIADYCTAMARSEIVVNRNYQRSDQVWPPVAKSYLIETILLGYPVPKLSLYQVLDLKSRKTSKEIVDGQQRSVTIFQYNNDEFALSRGLETEDVAGRKYSDLEPEFQSRFLEYSLAVDLFLSATPDEVVEVFRRMNSYTIPLNPEEQRHAVYQGPFKWFIARLARRLEAAFLGMGLFGQKQFVRMADIKLLTEICDALLNGIRTTSRSTLDNLYRSRNEEFPEQHHLGLWIEGAVDTVRNLPAIHGTSLIRPHIFYSLILAVIHIGRVVPALNAVRSRIEPTVINYGVAEVGLTTLASALDAEDSSPPLVEFVRACTDRTNVKEQREIRFRWLCDAMAGAFPH